MPLIRFGEFELDEQTCELRRNGSLIRIQQQPARILAFLLNHQGALVSRKEIQNAIWGRDTFVDFEQSLNFCIRQIRITLNDQAEKPIFIETLPRQGYRFIGRAEMIRGSQGTAEGRRIRIGVLPIEERSSSLRYPARRPPRDAKDTGGPARRPGRRPQCRATRRWGHCSDSSRHPASAWCRCASPTRCGALCRGFTGVRYAQRPKHREDELAHRLLTAHHRSAGTAIVVIIRTQASARIE